MVTVQQIAFGYKRSQTLFSSLSLEIPQGSIIGLLGRNGEGKSTLMKLITGQLHPRSGRVQTLGYEAPRRLVPMLQQVYMLAEDVVLPRMTVREYFDVLAPYYPTYDPALAEELITTFDLDWRMNTAQISLGQKKKVAIALALSLRTPLLLLDEPTNGLDIPSKSVFRRMLAKHIREEQTIIISTHQVRDLEQLIDRIVLLDSNRIVCNESIEHLSQLFSFGPVSEGTAHSAIYREPSVMGEYGVWASRDEDEMTDFSMELFFNAMVGAREGMQRIIGSHLLSSTSKN